MPAHSIDNALRIGSLDTASRLYKFVLSTIQSPAFSQVTVSYQPHDFRAIVPKCPLVESYLRQLSLDQEAEEASKHRKRFELLREILKARDFRLVLHPDADVRGVVEGYVVQMLNEAVAAERVTGAGFDFVFTEPLVTLIPRAPFC